MEQEDEKKITLENSTEVRGTFFEKGDCQPVVWSSKSTWVDFLLRSYETKLQQHQIRPTGRAFNGDILSWRSALLMALSGKHVMGRRYNENASFCRSLWFCSERRPPAHTPWLTVSDSSSSGLPAICSGPHCFLLELSGGLEGQQCSWNDDTKRLVRYSHYLQFTVKRLNFFFRQECCLFLWRCYFTDIACLVSLLLGMYNNNTGS